MFMDQGKSARPLPCHSIIKEVQDVEEAREVKEATQPNRLNSGAMEKICYDANHPTCIVR
jgi:hypothetical protein